MTMVDQQVPVFPGASARVLAGLPSPEPETARPGAALRPGQQPDGAGPSCGPIAIREELAQP
jgi:hypothetical protein